MKLTVKKIFRDKVDHVTVYAEGTILEVNDKERAKDLVERGLCAKYEGKADAVFTLGEASAKAAKGSAKKAAAVAVAEETPAASAESEASAKAAKGSAKKAAVAASAETPEASAESEKSKGE